MGPPSPDHLIPLPAARATPLQRLASRRPRHSFLPAARSAFALRSAANASLESSRRARPPRPHQPAMARRCPAAAALLALALVLGCCLHTSEAWKTGRATFYGNEPWYWSIHHGSCGKGYIWPDQGTGWDVAALSDAHPEYRGSCGGCYEVKCASMSVRDGYGDSLSRDGVCRDPDASVIVTVTDTCPCQYQNNYYSNKRWCCGDMDHFDLSVWAFEKLTDMRWGVIPVQYRRVDCGSQPNKRAYGASFPGEFPSLSQAKSRPDLDWHKYFPNGGYMNAKSGDGSYKVSTDEFLAKAGLSGKGK